MRRDLSWVDVDDMMTALGFKFTKSGDEITFSCFGEAHAHGDRNPSARINSKTSKFLCNNPACGLRGDAVVLLSKLRDLSESEALRVLEERYGGAERSVEAGGLLAEVERIMTPEEAGIVERTPPSEEWVLDRMYTDIEYPERMDAVRTYLAKRGFSLRSFRDWQIGWDEISRMMTIPVRDAKGRLVGVKGRLIHEGAPKYRVLGDVLGGQARYGFHTYRKSEYVFGLDRAKGHDVVICEGELNAIALHQMGVPAVSIAGSEFSPRQAELIVEHVDSAVVYLDRDDAGIAGARKIVAALETYMPLRVVVGATGDAAEMWENCLPLIESALSPLLAELEQASM